MSEPLGSKGGYIDHFREVHLGEPGRLGGRYLVADWFRRNRRIYTNLTRLVDSPNERILVIYGNGHLAWLRHIIASDPTLRLRKLADFVVSISSRSRAKVGTRRVIVQMQQ